MTLDRITEQRKEKLARLRDGGIDPYPPRYHRTQTTKEAVAVLEQHEASIGANVSVKDLTDGNPSVTLAGRITARRSMGKIAFLDLRDGYGKIQLLMGDLLTAAQRELFKEIDISDIIGVSGRLFRTRTNEPTIAVSSLTILAKALHPLPEKWHGLSDVETRYRQRYLDLISNPEAKETFRLRSQIIAAIRQFFNQRDFLEVETPILQPAAGGALARPFITHHQALDQDFYLRIATELHLKRLIIGGFDRVYELGRIFRNEGIDTKHNPEFTTLESYEAYADYHDVMQMLEEMVSTVSRQVLGTTTVKFGEQTLNLEPPWPRLDLRQTVAKYSGIDYAQFPDADSLRAEMTRLSMKVDPQKDRGRLIDELISNYVEPHLMQPSFLVDYPVDMSPLAKRKPGDAHTVERFEAFAGCMEIANAFTELNDPLEQRERFVEEQRHRHPEGEPVETIDEDFLLAMEHGMPPTGGLGVGIDRLVMLLTNQQSIREVILFPQLKEKP